MPSLKVHPLTLVPRPCYNSSRHMTQVAAMLAHHAWYATTNSSRPNSPRGGASHSSGTRMTTRSLLSHTSSRKNSGGRTGWPCPGRRNTVGWTGHSGNSLGLNMDSRELISHRLFKVTYLISDTCSLEANGRYWCHDTHTISHR